MNFISLTCVPLYVIFFTLLYVMLEFSSSPLKHSRGTVPPTTPLPRFSFAKLEISFFCSTTSLLNFSLSSYSKMRGFCSISSLFIPYTYLLYLLSLHNLYPYLFLKILATLILHMLQFFYLYKSYLHNYY